jgi:hypothetical protein
MSGLSDGMSTDMLLSYVETRKGIAKRSERIVACAHILGLLRHCGDDSVRVSPTALAEIADLIDSNICAITEQLDEFIYVVDAEEVLDTG